MPRIAIFSDIHANINAFNAVLEDLQKSGGVDRMYCLGDVVGYGPRPNECLALARRHFQLTLKGNHEEALVKGAVDFNEMAKRAIDWTRRTILPDYSRATDEQIQQALSGVRTALNVERGMDLLSASTHENGNGSPLG